MFCWKEYVCFVCIFIFVMSDVYEGKKIFEKFTFLQSSFLPISLFLWSLKRVFQTCKINFEWRRIWQKEKREEKTLTTPGSKNSSDKMRKDNNNNNKSFDNLSICKRNILKLNLKRCNFIKTFSHHLKRFYLSEMFQS